MPLVIGKSRDISGRKKFEGKKRKKGKKSKKKSAAIQRFCESVMFFVNGHYNAYNDFLKGMDRLNLSQDIYS